MLVKRGDTMIEVMIAVAVFGLLSILTIQLMTSSLARAEGNLEQTMARNEINKQAEAIRFIYEQMIIERKNNKPNGTYATLWREKLTKQAPSGYLNNSYTTDSYKNADGKSCSEIMTGDKKSSSFIINTNNITISGSGNIKLAETFPTVNGGDATGIWINAKARMEGGGKVKTYDFYIHTCFDAIGSNVPTRLDTTVRLFNPDF